MTTEIVLKIVLGLLSVWMVLILYKTIANRQRRRHLHGGIQPEGQVRRVAKRRLTERAAPAFFCVTLLLSWLWMEDGPSTFVGWVALVGVTAVKTALFTLVFYATSDHILDRILPEDRGPSAAQDQGRE